LKKTFWLLCLIIAVLLTGCGADARSSPAAALPEQSETVGDVVAAAPLETCSFSDGLARFIECYNSCCAAYGNDNLLKADEGWRSSGDCRRYRQFENNWLEPELRVYVDDSDSIREIRIGFEDHGYTQWGQALSEERAFYTLRCLNGELSDEELERLIAEEEKDMKNTLNYVERDAEPEINDPRSCGDYILYQFFSGGVYYLCVRESAA